MQDVFKQALAAHKSGDYDAALRGYSALATFKNARHNLGALLSQLGRLAEAEAVLRPIVSQRPDFGSSRFSLGMVLLAQGRYAEGWPLYEARRELGNPSIFEPATQAPEWRGEPLSGRRVAICAEQGYGDQIMFSRYLPLLRERGADVLVACDARMRPFFAALGYATALFSVDRRDLPPCDVWAFFGSLPLLLGVAAPPPEVRLELPFSGRGRIGVVPRGDPRHANDQHRSLPPEFVDRLLEMGQDLRPEATGAADFLESAGLISSLSLVITVDTAIAHLSASLGVPTWVLLPAFGTDWRWMRNRSDCSWYAAVRLFRQPTPGDWASVFENVSAALTSVPGSIPFNDRSTDL